MCDVISGLERHLAATCMKALRHRKVNEWDELASKLPLGKYFDNNSLKSKSAVFHSEHQNSLVDRVSYDRMIALALKLELSIRRPGKESF